MTIALAGEEFTRNALLAMLPASVTARIAGGLDVVAAAASDVLVDMAEPLEHVYFPLDLVASLDQVLEDGDAAAPSTPGVALTGSEGVVGIERFFGADVATNRATVRIGGRAVRIDARLAREEFARGGAFQLLLVRAADYLFLQACANSACERVHSVERRLIRWLLMFDDRAQSGGIALTQEAFAQLMSVRRVSVTAAARLLQLQGLIAYKRGVVTIVDRPGLDERSCACYRNIKARHEALRNPS